MMSLNEVNARMQRLNGWSLERDRIEKDKEVANFKEALDYVNKIGEIAEKMNHHPM